MPTRFDHDIDAPRVPFREARKETPDRTVNVVVPFILALCAGFCTFVLVGLLAIGWRWTVKTPLIAAGLIGMAVMAIGLARFWLDDLITTVETITGIDVNQDGQVGEPKQITIEVQNPDNRSLKYLHLPIEERALRELCVGLIVHQRPFSEAEWTGRGQPFSRPEFREIRARLLEAGVVAWKDARHPQQGIEFTAWGRRVMREALESCAGVYRPQPALQEGGEVKLLEEGE